jgi:hypothetical protein
MFLSQDYRLAIAPPYPLYTFGIEDLLAGRPLRAARLTAWQYLLIEQDASVFALAEVAERKVAGERDLSFATLHPRRYAETIATTVTAAEELVGTTTASYDVRILRAPSIYALAVWLKGSDDLIFPVRSSKEQTTKEIWDDQRTIHGEKALAKVLRQAAELQLKPPMTTKKPTAKRQETGSRPPSPRSGRGR